MKPYGRKMKKQVLNILANHSKKEAMDQLSRIPDKQLTGHLFAHLYHMDEQIKFRSVTAMGVLALRITGHSMERARIILRRIMWNLNDESGGIGWGSAEAMGEILAKSPELAEEFKSILFSYLDTGGNHIEHDMLQRGVIWGVGSYLETAPQDLTPSNFELLLGYLTAPDPVKRGYAVRALINAQAFDCTAIPDSVKTDDTCISFYTGWHLESIRISDMCHACTRTFFSA